MRENTYRLLFLIIFLVLVIWVLLPAIRGGELVLNTKWQNLFPRHTASGIPATQVIFSASDGVKLHGWISMKSPTAPTIILVHGFKGVHTDMNVWQSFLFHAGYNVFTYDSRGCGQSSGWVITDGLKETYDVIGAANYVMHDPGIKNKKIGALGISLGAGNVIIAASKDHAIKAVVADSPWADEESQIARMKYFHLLFLNIPLLPYELPFVNTLIGGNLANAQPVQSISHKAPSAVFLIHAANDTNILTAGTIERKLFEASSFPKQEWVLPKGGHVGAITISPDEYKERVIAFFKSYVSVS